MTSQRWLLVVVVCVLALGLGAYFWQQAAQDGRTLGHKSADCAFSKVANPNAKC